MSDALLLQKLKQREPQGLEEAIGQYAPYVAAVIRKTMNSLWEKEDGEELVSDVFVALWENAGKLRDDSSLKYWLAVVARNAALRRLKARRPEDPLEESLLFPQEEPLFLTAEKKERDATVRNAVESLGAQDKDIFLRHYFWYQTVADISLETGMNESTVKSRLKRGREKLREKLRKEEYTNETHG